MGKNKYNGAPNAPKSTHQMVYTGGAQQINIHQKKKTKTIKPQQTTPNHINTPTAKYINPTKIKNITNKIQ